MTRRTAIVYADHQMVTHGGLIDGIEIPFAIGHDGPHRHDHLDKPGMISNTIDLSGRQLGILTRHDQRRLEPGFRFQPYVPLPVIDSHSHRSGQILMVDALHPIIAR